MTEQLSADQVNRRAGGRRRYAKQRLVRAELRRSLLADLLLGGCTQAEAARELQVHKSTISRDLVIMIREAGKSHCCPVCGHYVI